MKKAIVVGATSGIGRQLALLLANNQYMVGITGRRGQLLTELQHLKPGNFIASVFDVTSIAQIPIQLKKLSDELGGLDLLIMSSGTGELNPSLNPDIELQTVAINVAGFTAVADWHLRFLNNRDPDILQL